MTPERHQRVKQIFLQACELPLDARPAFMDETCGEDTELRAMVDSLLCDVTVVSPSGSDSTQVTAPRWFERRDRLVPGVVVDNRYRVEAALGAGSMGEVYRARQLALDRLVAIKVLPPIPHAQAGRRFELEARAIARLRHPNVVTVHDFGHAPGVGAYLVMEYVDGRSLRAELKQRGVLAIAEALSLMQQVCDGVEAAHKSGVIHRDLKPENILLEGIPEKTSAKVADFGIAKLVESPDAGAESLTIAGAVLGTPHYMSPEQCRGEELDVRSDVYALGCVLYELLSGRPPFSAESHLALLQKHQTAQPLPLRVLRPEVPDELERVIARALAKLPERRWQSASEFGLALQGVVRHVANPEAALFDASDSGLTTIVEIGPQEVSGKARVTVNQASATSPPDNLPRPVTRCIGRERELSELTVLLLDDDMRLVTIVGPGGIGKTRLAVEVAAALVPQFPDGVFEVDLSPLVDPSQLAQHIAHVFGVAESAEHPVADGLARYLAEKRMLLVLDNFEHLLSAAPFVAHLLSHTAWLTVLATSQSPLRLRGEREYALDALGVPAPASRMSLDDLSRAPSVALFLERARSVKPAFALTEENAETVIEICRQLDGLPLAIELAAARVKLLAPSALLERLSNALTLLTGGARDLPERQQTMRAAVRWSYDMLDDADRALLRRVSVFVGGCTLQACEAVCGGEDVDVLEGVASLVNKSLLVQRDRDGEARFRTLEVVRQFALEQLEVGGEGESARLLHARHFLNLALEAEPKLVDHDAFAIAMLEREHENLTSALGHLLEQDAPAGARMVVALWRYWYFRSLFSEGLSWARRALAAEEAEPLERAWLLAVIGGFESLLGEHTVAGEHLDMAVAASRVLADRRVLTLALINAGVNCLKQTGMLARARACFEEALSIVRALGQENLAGTVLINLAAVADAEGDRARVRAYTEEALGLRLFDHNRAACLMNLGDIFVEEGAFADARRCLREGLVLAARYGDRARAAFALESLAVIALREGTPAHAALLSGAVDALYEATGGVRTYTSDEPWERTLAMVRTALEPEDFELEWTRGRAMSFEEAVAAALG